MSKNLKQKYKNDENKLKAIDEINEHFESLKSSANKLVEAKTKLNEARDSQDQGSFFKKRTDSKAIDKAQKDFEKASKKFKKESEKLKKDVIDKFTLDLAKESECNNSFSEIEQILLEVNLVSEENEKREKKSFEFQNSVEVNGEEIFFNKSNLKAQKKHQKSEEKFEESKRDLKSKKEELKKAKLKGTKKQISQAEKKVQKAEDSLEESKNKLKKNLANHLKEVKSELRSNTIKKESEGKFKTDEKNYIDKLVAETKVDALQKIKEQLQEKMHKMDRLDLKASKKNVSITKQSIIAIKELSEKDQNPAIAKFASNVRHNLRENNVKFFSGNKFNSNLESATQTLLQMTEEFKAEKEVLESMLKNPKLKSRLANAFTHNNSHVQKQKIFKQALQKLEEAYDTSINALSEQHAKSNGAKSNSDAKEQFSAVKTQWKNAKETAISEFKKTFDGKIIDSIKKGMKEKDSKFVDLVNKIVQEGPSKGGRS